MIKKLWNGYGAALDRAGSIQGFGAACAEWTLFFTPIVIVAIIFGTLLFYTPEVLAGLGVLVVLVAIGNALRFFRDKPEFANPNATSKTVPTPLNYRVVETGVLNGIDEEAKQPYHWFENGQLVRGTKEQHKEAVERRRVDTASGTIDDADYDPDTYPREF
jgi:hypothetical protein